jgi:O-antigen/teichoic acid export membrane protein
MSNSRSIFVNTSALIVASLLTRMLTVPVSALLIRVLNQQEFGQYSYLISYVSLFAPLTVLGLPSYLNREVSLQPDRVPILLKASYVLMFLLSVATGLLIACTGQGGWLLFIATIGMVASSTGTLMQLSISGLKRSYLIGIAQVLTSAVVSLGTLTIVIFAPRVETLIWLFTLSGVLQHATYIVIAWKYCPELKFAQTWPVLQEYRKLFIESLPYVLLVAFLTIYFRIDIVLLERWSNLLEVARYSAVYKFIEIVLILVGIFGQVFFSEFTDMEANGGVGVERLLQRGFRYMILLSLPLSIFMAYYARDILYIFYGEKYLDSTTTLQILAWTTVFLFARTLPSVLIQSRNYIRVLVIIYGLSSVINIGLNYLLIPAWGGVGAAVTTLVCEVFNFLGLAWFLRYRLGISLVASWYFPTLLAFLSTIGMLFALRTWPTYIGLPLGMTTYIGVLAVARGIYREDVEYVRHLLSRMRRS